MLWRYFPKGYGILRRDELPVVDVQLYSNLLFPLCPISCAVYCGFESVEEYIAELITGDCYQTCL